MNESSSKFFFLNITASTAHGKLALAYYTVFTYLPLRCFEVRVADHLLTKYYKTLHYSEECTATCIIQCFSIDLPLGIYEFIVLRLPSQ